MSDSKPSFEFLLRCSHPSLEGIELAELNQAANLRKRSSELLARILDQWVEAEVEARLTRLIRDARRELPSRRRGAPRLGAAGEQAGDSGERRPARSSLSPLRVSPGSDDSR